MCSTVLLMETTHTNQPVTTPAHCQDLDPADAGSISEALRNGEDLTVSAIVQDDNVMIYLNGHVVGNVSVDWAHTAPTEAHYDECDYWANEDSECPGFETLEVDVFLSLSRREPGGDPRTDVTVRTW